MFYDPGVSVWPNLDLLVKEYMLRKEVEVCPPLKSADSKII